MAGELTINQLLPWRSDMSMRLMLQKMTMHMLQGFRTPSVLCPRIRSAGMVNICIIPKMTRNINKEMRIERQREITNGRRKNIFRQLKWVPRLLLNFYCRIVIPSVYREDAFLDLTENFNQKTFDRALVDLWKYTGSSVDYRLNWLMEFWMHILFYVDKILDRVVSEPRI